MFMCSGQLFSQGESASSSHTPRGTGGRGCGPRTRGGSAHVVSSGLGAVCPSPHNEVSRIMRPHSRPDGRGPLHGLARA